MAAIRRCITVVIAVDTSEGRNSITIIGATVVVTTVITSRVD